MLKAKGLKSVSEIDIKALFSQKLTGIEIVSLWGDQSIENGINS